jgi:hypothetical protein
MARLPNRPRRGRRGGDIAKAQAEAARLQDIHSKIRGMRSRQDGHNLKGTSVTALAADHAKYNTHATIEEFPETHLVPRHSITRKYKLEHFPEKVRIEPIPTKLWDGKKLVPLPLSECPVRVVERSDKTLLTTTKQFTMVDDLVREGSISQGLNKRKIKSKFKIVPEEPEVMGDYLGESAEIFPEPEE